MVHTYTTIRAKYFSDKVSAVDDDGVMTGNLNGREINAVEMTVCWDVSKVFTVSIIRALLTKVVSTSQMSILMADYTAQHYRRQPSSYLLTWERESSIKCCGFSRVCHSEMNCQIKCNT